MSNGSRYIYTHYAIPFIVNSIHVFRDVTNTRNGERGTGNGERGTGNGEPGTGVWEQVYSGNPLENSQWRSKQKKRLEEKQFGLR